jgi:hypothetical protein
MANSEGCVLMPENQDSKIGSKALMVRRKGLYAWPPKKFKTFEKGLDAHVRGPAKAREKNRFPEGKWLNRWDPPGQFARIH